MKKKMKCMADGGMPQERKKIVQDETPEWKKSLANAWQAIAGNREPPKEKPPTADSLGDTANRIKGRNRQAQEIASYANGGMPGQVEAFQDGVRQIAVGTGITPPNMVPTEAQGLAAVGAPTGGALTAAAQQAPIPVATPGNVFANPQAGNMLTPSGGSMTLAEKSRAAGLDPNAAYRPGSAQDPHVSGLAGLARKPAAPEPDPQQQAPQVSTQAPTIETMPRVQTKTPGLADGGIARYKFEGNGGPRDDKIPAKIKQDGEPVAEINVSNGEQAVILPVKTAQNPQAIAAIGQVIEQSNDGRKPAMGISEGGKYAAGATGGFQSGASGRWEDPNRFANALSANPNNQAIASLHAKEAERLKGFDTAAVAQAVGGVPVEKQQIPGMSQTVPAAQIQKTPLYSAQADDKMGVPEYLPPPDPRIAQNTGNAGDARVDPASGNLHFTQKGFDPTQQQFAPGSGAITDPKTGRTILVPPQAIAQAPDNAPRDRHGNDMTQTLALRDELNRARADRAWQNMSSPTEGYRQQGMAQLQALAQIGALDTESMRRLGMKQQNDANIPGADSQLKGQAIAQGGLAMQQAQELNALYQAHNAEQNPEKRSMIAEQIRVRTGKDKPATHKAVVLSGAKTLDGQEADRAFLINEQGGTFSPLGMSPQQAPDGKLPPRDQLKIGQTYPTAQGPMVWRGNGFEAVK